MIQYQLDVLEMGKRVAMFQWFAGQIIRDTQGHIINHAFAFAKAKRKATQQKRLK